MKIILLLLLIISLYGHAQLSTSKYNSHELFSPLFYPPSINEYRSATGEPGPAYWQNKVNYQIAATLDDVKNEVTATITITYINNSPHNLPFLWLQLDQNLFNKNSRGFSKLPANGVSRYGDINTTFNGGYKITSVKIISGTPGKIVETPVDPVINDTRMQIILPGVLAAKGTVKFRIQYSFLIPPLGSDRTGIFPSNSGNIYSIGQWFPRMCVFDDVQGWNTLPYLGGGEFYCEFGDFDLTINAPAGHIVVASGDLQNASEVLTPVQLKRFNAAKQSDSTVLIRTHAEVIQPSTANKRLTWHFKISNARDVAWASSKAFIWDAAKINLPGNRKAMAMSVYPPESDGIDGWRRSTEFVKGTLENYSKRWMPYPYNTAVNVAGNINGMEYPGIIFCLYKDSGDDLFDVTNHELGHTWFPMIVGSNERKYGWMDEGFATFIENIIAMDFNGGEFDKKSVYDRAYEKFGEGSEPVMKMPDALQESNIGTALYYKPAYALHLLRNHVIGHQRFDYAFKMYISRWAFKHPTPFDFFRTIENATGEDLGWFWKSMLIENFNLDQRVNEPVYVGGDPAKGAMIVIDNLDRMAMPVYLQYETVSGGKEMIKVPVEVWQNHISWIVKINTTEKIRKVIIDPDRIFPDINYDNNKWND